MKLQQLSDNFIIAMDHIYEDIIKLQTVVIKKQFQQCKVIRYMFSMTTLLL